MRILGIVAPGAALDDCAIANNRRWKLICSTLCLIVLASNFCTMRNWTEHTGVYDDICYLRQAHLFQRFGLGGFDTDISRDDDRYFATLAREIGYPAWNDQSQAPCHTPIRGKHIIQYPPGTGFALSIFPAGFQRVPLYAVANIVIFFAAIFSIWSAKSRRWIATSTIVGFAALYFMINPSKASFSIAPTMIVCATMGFLTKILMNASASRHRFIAAALAGLFLGLAVSLRLPNLFLSVGYFAVLLTTIVWSRNSDDIWRFILFGAAYLAGLSPTLVANAINAGGALSSTYGAGDALPPDFSFSIAREYIADMQGVLIIITFAWAVLTCVSTNARALAVIVIVNLVFNLLFFLSHPIFTPYYLMPLAMLSLWTLLDQSRQEERGTPQLSRPTAARSTFQASA